MEILNFEEQPKGSYHLALFDVFFGQVWGLTLRKFKLCRNKTGHFYFQSPCFKKGELDGKALWGNYVDFNAEKGKDFSNTVMQLLKPHIDRIKQSE